MLYLQHTNVSIQSSRIYTVCVKKLKHVKACGHSVRYHIIVSLSLSFSHSILDWFFPQCLITLRPCSPVMSERQNKRRSKWRVWIKMHYGSWYSMLTQVCVYPEECLACLVRHAHILTPYNSTILITISRKLFRFYG